MSHSDTWRRRTTGESYLDTMLHHKKSRSPNLDTALSDLYCELIVRWERSINRRPQPP